LGAQIPVRNLLSPALSHDRKTFLYWRPLDLAWVSSVDAECRAEGCGATFKSSNIALRIRLSLEVSVRLIWCDVEADK